MYIKTLDLSTIDRMNAEYAASKSDGYTVAWREAIQRGEFYYLLLDEISQPYFNGAELVEELPSIHEWHFDLKYQIIFTEINSLRMLQKRPEIGVYCKQNDIVSVIENGFVYIYVDFILPEHRVLFEVFNAEINERPE